MENSLRIIMGDTQLHVEFSIQKAIGQPLLAGQPPARERMRGFIKVLTIRIVD